MQYRIDAVIEQYARYDQRRQMDTAGRTVRDLNRIDCRRKNSRLRDNRFGGRSGIQPIGSGAPVSCNSQRLENGDP